MGSLDGFFHYFPVNDDVLRWGAYVTGAGIATILPAQQYPPSGHPVLYDFDWRRGRTLPEFQMVLINLGGGEFESAATGRVSFRQPTIMWLFPGVWHRYRPLPEAGWTERWFSFNGDLCHRLAANGLIHPSRAVAAIGDAPTLVEKFDAMLQQIHANPMSHTGLHSLQVMRLVAETVDCVTKQSPATGNASSPSEVRPEVDELAEAALQLIWTRSHHSLSSDDVAERLQVARRTLDRRFAAATGRSILEEINACRLMRAKRLLARTDLSMRSIANLVGFASSERMGILFARSEGLTPSEYRRRRMRSSVTPIRDE